MLIDVFMELRKPLNDKFKSMWFSKKGIIKSLNICYPLTPLLNRVYQLSSNMLKTQKSHL